MVPEVPATWSNDIRLRYSIRLMPGSTKSPEQAADDMITGVTIGTAQSSQGRYTPKTHCLYGPHPGFLKGEVADVSPHGDGEYIVDVVFSDDISQVADRGFAGLMSVAAGDGLGTAYEMARIRLTDMHLPDHVVSAFPGPAFGSAGIRSWLRHESVRPLVALLLKPNTGQPSEHYAEYARQAAFAGVDYIKEDELQFNHPACPLLDRTRKILDALKKVQDTNGHRTMYAPNITSGSQAQMLTNAEQVVELGASAVMINVMQVGLDSLRVLRNADIGVPIHIHRTGHDNYSRGDVGVDLTVLSSLFRLGGADLIHTGPVFGNLFDPDSIVQNVLRITSPSMHRPALPILSRSARSALQDSVDYLATDASIEDPSNVMFLVDRDVYQDADPETGAIQRAAEEFVAAVHAVTPIADRGRDQILASQGLDFVTTG